MKSSVSFISEVKYITLSSENNTLTVHVDQDEAYNISMQISPNPDSFEINDRFIKYLKSSSYLNGGGFTPITDKCKHMDDKPLCD